MGFLLDSDPTTYILPIIIIVTNVFLSFYTSNPASIKASPFTLPSCIYSDACFIAKLNKSLNIILILASMSNYRKIADEFSRMGYRETARLNEY